MNIHEYQAKELLARFGVNIPRQKLCYTATEAEWAARSLNGETKPTVVKAQVHAGGRGKGGGVKFAKTPDDARAQAEKILGMTLVTPQTGPQGKFVRKVLVVDAGPSIEKEYYLALVVNRDKATIGFMLSPEGGMDIEEVAHKTPEKIFNENVDPTIGLQACHLRKMSSHFGFTGDLAKQFEKVVRGLYDCFLAYDCAMLEINPLAITKDGEKLSVQVLDCKMSFDDNALFRHPELKDLRDYDEEDEKELEASRYGLNYIALEGNIGCLVNGAGLAMATMDIIKQYGGAPANFLDVGGGATQEMVTQAFRIILRDPHVKGIFVNIFGGIMKCDIIANGVVAATKELGLKIPLVVRLEGTNVEEGKKILNSSGLNILAADSMGDGAGKIVKAVQSK